VVTDPYQELKMKAFYFTILLVVALFARTAEAVNAQATDSGTETTRTPAETTTNGATPSLSVISLTIALLSGVIVQLVTRYRAV